MSGHYFQIGILGFISLFILTLFIIWRWWCFLHDLRHIVAYNQSFAFKVLKKNVFFVCLLAAAISDIPMYIGFIVVHGYSMIPYSFHKLQAAFLFAAYSLTISDWTLVLFEIHEDSYIPFLLRRATLIFLNVMFFIISVINFIYCYTTMDMESFLNSTVYEVGVLFLIITPFLLTCFMLHSGLKLSWRIQGAAGVAEGNRQTSFLGSIMTRNSKVDELLAAVKRLNVVMMVCGTAISIQIVLMTLNLAMGLSNKTNATVGPDYFYYILIGIVPLSTLVFAQLYLTQSSSLRGAAREPNFEALLSDYDFDSESVNDTSIRKSRAGLWTSEMSWSTSDAQSIVNSSQSSIYNFVPRGKGGSSVGGGSVANGIRTSKKYRDPLLDFQYSNDLPTSSISGLTSDKLTSSADSNPKRKIVSPGVGSSERNADFAIISELVGEDALFDGSSTSSYGLEGKSASSSNPYSLGPASDPGYEEI